jgi:hypothetical protein
VYFVLTADYSLFMDTQQTIILETMQLLDQLGISTAKRAQPVNVIANEVQPVPQVAQPAPARDNPAARPTLIKTAYE